MAIAISTVSIYIDILLLFLSSFIFHLFTLMFDTAFHTCIIRDGTWHLCSLNSYSYILTTLLCYYQYLSFSSTVDPIHAVWYQFIHDQPQKRKSRRFLPI